MKEEAPSKKLPPKSAATMSSTTPTKVGNDEILNALLRINNFDSISRESLDIDLSACVTFCGDPAAAMMGGNSLSSTDFWRMLDESAQNPQLDITGSSDEGAVLRDLNDELCGLPPPSGSASSTGGSGHFTIGVSTAVKQEEAQPSSFSGTFLRPDPPTALSLFSPLKKAYKSLPPAADGGQQQRQRKIVKTTLSIFESKKARISPPIKLEPPEQLLADTATSYGIAVPPTTTSVTTTIRWPGGGKDMKSISAAASSSFSIFKLPVTSASTNAKAIPITTKSPSVPLAPVAQDVAEEPAASALPLYKCLDCDVLLHGTAALAPHESNGHRLAYKCSLCEREFEQEPALKKHLKTHRSVETRKDVWKKCPDCGKCLKLGSMWMHRKIHSDNKKYGCDICGQKFVQKINLTHHSRVHTAEKPYECPECQKRFQERSHLQRHQKYHAQTRSYRCDKCGKMYKTERCLKVHNLVHLEQRPFACNVCDKSFISNSKLKQHSNIHTGERPFKCNYCPRDFTNFPNWLKHTRRRHKVDHKTGEQLENIPSYCSKKPTKAARDKAAAAAASSATKVSSTSPTEAGSSTLNASNPVVLLSSSLITAAATNLAAAATPKAQSKRKKKSAPPELSAITIVAPATTTTGEPRMTVNASVGDGVKATKVKRERKQLAPKQVQKAPPLLLVTQQQAQQIIKQEPIESKTGVADGSARDASTMSTAITGGSAFPDLHGLSITSAEELIMEQALEMEECGLYDAPASAADTDNAISSDAATALHFKIKNEYLPIDAIKEEEFVSLKEAKHRVLCSSLESSPFSSPASIELNSNTLVAPTSISALPGTTTYFLTTSAPFPLQAHVTGTAGDSVATSATMTQLTLSTPSTSTAAQLQQPVTSTTQTLINHLYLPMTVRMPLLVQPHQQVLPSVDTLLFSSHAANAKGFYHGKNVTATTTAQQNLS